MKRCSVTGITLATVLTALAACDGPRPPVRGADPQGTASSSSASSAAPPPSATASAAPGAAKDDAGAGDDPFFEGDPVPGAGARALPVSGGAKAWCEPVQEHFGAGTPEAGEVLDAVAKVQAWTCFNNPELREVVQHCMDAASSPRVRLIVRKGKFPSCSLTLTTAEWKGRRWVRLWSTFRKDATVFLPRFAIYEIKGKTATAYYDGPPPRCNALDKDSSMITSAAMRGEWATLPRDLKEFFGCD